jgi:phosphoribosylglycinamide formyltransferase-1
VAFRIAVLVSGEGTNLQAILDTLHRRELTTPRGVEPLEVAAVAASRPEARGLARARHAGVETAVFGVSAYEDRSARDLALADWLEARRVELVVLAGFMEILGGEFIRRFAGRIVNVHPSLLPAFQGVRAIERAVDHGVKVTGVTVHFVDEGVDSGPIILQESLELTHPCDIGELEERLHEIEHRLLPRAVRLIAEGRVRMDPSNARVVRVLDGGGD